MNPSTLLPVYLLSAFPLLHRQPFVNQPKAHVASEGEHYYNFCEQNG